MAVLVLTYSSTGCKHQRKKGYAKGYVRVCAELLSSFSQTGVMMAPMSHGEEGLQSLLCAGETARCCGCCVCVGWRDLLPPNTQLDFPP